MKAQPAAQVRQSKLPKPPPHRQRWSKCKTSNGPCEFTSLRLCVFACNRLFENVHAKGQRVFHAKNPGSDTIRRLVLVQFESGTGVSPVNHAQDARATKQTEPVPEGSLA